jgi:hypothetical protein
MRKQLIQQITAKVCDWLGELTQVSLLKRERLVFKEILFHIPSVGI